MKQLFLIMLFALPLFADQNQIEQMLEPVVQVRSEYSVASGTVIYSHFNRTIILTNFHVIDTCIENRGTEEEFTRPVKIEFRTYLDGGNHILKEEKIGEVICHDHSKDLALILVMHYQTDRVAPFLPDDFKLKLFDDVYTVGNPGGTGETHFYLGKVSSLRIIRENALYGHKAVLIGHSAHVFYGSSGGALFIEKDEKYYIAGVPNSVYNFNGIPITWMSYSVSLETIKIFFIENFLKIEVRTFMPKEIEKRKF